MAVLAAVNFPDGLVLLEDGRELPITQYYAAKNGEAPLTAESQLLHGHRVDRYEDAQVFAVLIPESGGCALVVEIDAMSLATSRQIN